MSGAYSRNKGARNERELVNYLKEQGWQAERILRQYQVSNEPDVVATKGDKTITLEMKSRRSSFSKIYELLDEQRKENDCVQRFIPSNLQGACVCYDINCILSPCQTYLPIDEKDKRFLKTLKCLDEFLGKANILVLKDDRRPMMFLKRW